VAADGFKSPSLHLQAGTMDMPAPEPSTTPIRKNVFSGAGACRSLTLARTGPSPA